MRIISDSSSLILLEKSELLGILADKTKIVIPERVYREVVEEGIKRSMVNAVNIDKLVKNKKIFVKKVKKTKEFSISLGKGEKEALELYYQEKADKIIVDDKKALNLCKIFKIPYITVHVVLIDLLRKKLINKKEAIKSLEILDKEGRYSSGITLHYYEKIMEES